VSLYEIPMSRRRTCVFCASIVDSNADGVYEFVQGWARNRKQGTNAVALQKRMNVFACDICIDKLKAGIPVGQQSLFTYQEQTP
jgi:hypothetical protein